LKPTVNPWDYQPNNLLQDFRKIALAASFDQQVVGENTPQWQVSVILG
jgi:hypothetical protein